MKKNKKQAFRWTSGIMLALLMAIQVHAQQPFVYARDGSKFYLEYAEQYLISIEGIVEENKLDQIFDFIKQHDPDAFRVSQNSFVTDALKNPLDNIAKMVPEAKPVPTATFRSSNGGLLWVTNSIVAITDNLAAVGTVLSGKGVTSFEVDTICHNANIVNIYPHGGKFDIISLSNALFESGCVEYVHPDWGMTVEECENPYFSGQWNLHGGNNLEGINLHTAWDYTSGAGVRVAVLDNGVYLTHPDLIANMGPGYNVLTGTNDASCSPDGAHGTQVSGIIVAADNDIGIKGIAYNSTLLPVKINGSASTFASAIIRGICHIVDDMHADILNISAKWDVSDSISTVSDALEYATVYGRNGRGCIVTAAIGNDGVESQVYPAIDKNTIAVGATDPQGNRLINYQSQPSNYGSHLDIMAPGVNIPTTTIPAKNYYRWPPDSGSFGTSAACPHVAGVAALMLSANPSLTRNEVYAILMATARKTGNVPYYLTPGRPYGTWNREMGYGLLNADSAAWMAREMAHSGDLYVRDNPYDNGLQPTPSAAPHTNSPDIILLKNGIPVNSVQKDETYDVHIIVRNCDQKDTPEGRKVKLYWSYVNNSMSWPEAWNGGDYGVPCPRQRGGYIGECTLPHIYAGGMYEASVQWTVPDLSNIDCTLRIPDYDTRWGCSLLAVVDDGRVVPGEKSVEYDITDFVTQNNNVARKDITVLHEGGTPVMAALMRVADLPGPLRLVYKAPHTGGLMKPCLNETADVTLTFNEVLKYAFESRNVIPDGCEYAGDGVLTLTDCNVVFDSLNIPADDPCYISASVHFTQPIPSALQPFTFDIEAYTLTDLGPVYIGKITYYAVYDEHFHMLVQAHESMQAMAGDVVTFTAQAENEDADFVWYTQSGDTAGTGAELAVNASSSQKFYVVGTARDDGAVGYDSVTLTVVEGEISSLSPNPASGQVNISYRLAEGLAGASVAVCNATGIVCYSAAISADSHIHTASIQTLPPGQYMVRIEANGAVLDSKILIVY